MIDFTSIHPPAEITEQDVYTVRMMQPSGQTNVQELPWQDWPEWARIDLQTVANIREYYTRQSPPKPAAQVTKFEPWPFPWHVPTDGTFGTIMAANGEPVAMIHPLAVVFDSDIVRRNEWRNHVARRVCDAMNTADTDAMAGYVLLTEGELTRAGDEFQKSPGQWWPTSRIGRLVHSGLVGAYRRPTTPAANA